MAQKVVYKYATGEPIPEGAVYLSTIRQTHIPVELGSGTVWDKCWLVWHYFLVEIPDGKCKHCEGQGCRACDARKQ